MIKGVQYESNYFALQTFYRKEFAAFSPGATAFHLTVEDLLTNRPVRRIEFGFGEPNRKHYSANTVLDVAYVFLMRKTFANRLQCAMHSAFFSGVRTAKWFRHQLQDIRSARGALGTRRHPSDSGSESVQVTSASGV
jgi:hypothetical protein